MWRPSFLRAALPAPPPSPVTSEAVRGASLDLDRFSRDIAREYTRNLYIWRCVDAIAGLASSVPLKVVKNNDKVDDLRLGTRRVGQRPAGGRVDPFRESRADRRLSRPLADRHEARDLIGSRLDLGFECDAGGQHSLAHQALDLL
jgi:hypothetical protein